MIDVKSRGSGYYRVYVDDVEISQHITEREAEGKAIEEAINLAFDNPSAKVHYAHDYEVDVTINAKDITVKAISGGTLTQPDSEPDPIAGLFVDETDVTASTTRLSNQIQILGVDSFASVTIEVSGDGGYRLNGGLLTTAPGIGTLGDLIALEHQSNAGAGLDANTTLTLDGTVSDTFTSTTESAVVGSAVWLLNADYAQECYHDGDPAHVGSHAIADGIANDNDHGWNGMWNHEETQNIQGRYTQAVAAAKSPGSDGALGYRFWNNDLGTGGRNSGSLRPDLTVLGTDDYQPEFWLRWYMRWEAGYAWNGSMNYDKIFYVYTGHPSGGPGGGGGSIQLFLPYPRGSNQGSGRFDLAIQSGSVGNPANGFKYSIAPCRTSGFGWYELMGGPVSDGLFHMFEVYVKFESALGVEDGEGRIWIDNVLRAENTSFTYSNYPGAGWDANDIRGVRWAQVDENQATPSLVGMSEGDGIAYVDYDDIEFWITPPPARDADDNPYIGPINGFTGGYTP